MKKRTNARILAKAGEAALNVLLAAVMLFYLFPVAMTFMYSFKTPQEVLMSAAYEPPRSWTYVENYRLALVGLDYFRMTLNTLVLTGLSVGGALALAALTAYAVARGSGRYLSFIYLLFVGGLLIPYQATFVPTFLIGSRLGMVNSLPGVSFFYIAGILPFAVFMLTGFMKTVPREIEQAAIVDGCGTARLFASVVLPLMKPALVTLAIMRSLLVWNDYLMVKMFLQREKLQTITVRIANLFGTYRYNLNIAFAAVLLSSIPILAFFIYNQKNIEKGIAVGGVKG